jgi:hypothetical protein
MIPWLKTETASAFGDYWSALVDHIILWSVILVVFGAATGVAAGALWAIDRWKAWKVQKEERARAERLNALFRPRPRNLL